jgi:hypothetical protein
MEEATHTFGGRMAFGPTSSKLIKHFDTISHFDVIPYAVLNGVAGKDVRDPSAGGGRGALDTARNEMLRQGRRMGVVPGVGLKFLTADEAADDTNTGRVLVGRKIRRENKKASVVDIAGLSDDRKTMHLSNVAMFGALCLFSDGKRHRELAAGIQARGLTAPHVLDRDKLLAAFAG